MFVYLDDVIFVMEPGAQPPAPDHLTRSVRDMAFTWSRDKYQLHYRHRGVMMNGDMPNCGVGKGETKESRCRTVECVSQKRCRCASVSHPATCVAISDVSASQVLVRKRKKGELRTDRMRVHPLSRPLAN